MRTPTGASCSVKIISLNGLHCKNCTTTKKPDFLKIYKKPLVSSQKINKFANGVSKIFLVKILEYSAKLKTIEKLKIRQNV